MLICVKHRISELESEQRSAGTELVSLKIDQSIDDEEPGRIKNVAKIFINEFSENSLDEALECLLKTCTIMPSVILGYHPTSRAENEKFIWADNDPKSKIHFKFLWNKLREAQVAGKIGQLGIADMDLSTIMDIFDDNNFDFKTLQINLATCCVVPPELQDFCKDHEIQLLTHSDPQGK